MILQNKDKTVLTNQINALVNAKNKKEFENEFPTFFEDKKIISTMLETSKAFSKDIVLEGEVYFKEFHLVNKSSLIRAEKINESTKIKKNDLVLVMASDGKNSLIHAYKYKKINKKIIYESFDKHIKAGATLTLIDYKIYSKLLKNPKVDSVTFTFKEFIKMPNFKNPFTKITWNSNKLVNFLKICDAKSEEELVQMLDLFSFVFSMKLTAEQKANLIIKNSKKQL